jgi:negative regulator of sigma E activity
MEQDVTRNIEEQLSAFLDGELPDDELQLCLGVVGPVIQACEDVHARPHTLASLP